MSEENAITQAELDQCEAILKRIALEIGDDIQISVTQDGRIYFDWGGSYDAAWLDLGTLDEAVEFIKRTDRRGEWEND